ncbi:MAG TPA: hypothetical protein VMT00_04435 [Thermoanaerobaculia bacterium]|nr:hypothetical protein [Thermoanaerobaculia bacterium]
MASKSAAAYREAEAKGIRVGAGHEHGGHAPSWPVAEAAHAVHGEMAAPDHTAMGHQATADAHAGHGEMAAMDHVAMGHAKAGHAARGPAMANAHAQHGAMPRDQHAAMQHTPSPGADSHAQHRQQPPAAQLDHGQHGVTQAPADGADPETAHTVSGSMARAMTMSAPRSNAEMQRVQPASTLRGDAFDAPAPSSVSEAAKATQGHEGHGK